MNLRLLIGLLLFGLIKNPLFAQQNALVYQSESLQIEQVSEHVFIHVSYLQTQDFGKVACNGMLVLEGNEALIFDTPTSNEVSEELIRWIEADKKAMVKGVLATHFHDDCLGGLEAFHAREIPSFGSDYTIDLAQKADEAVPQHGFSEELIQELGEIKVVSKYFGEGHTRDNVVVYVPSERVLFGGCLIKELNASVGYLGDANVGTWSETVRGVKAAFGDIKMVIPGHGKAGGVELLDYTIQLFMEK